VLVLHCHEALLPTNLSFATFLHVKHWKRRGWPRLGSGSSWHVALVFYMFAKDLIVTAGNSRAIRPRTTDQSVEQVDGELLCFCLFQRAQWENDPALSEFGAERDS